MDNRNYFNLFMNRGDTLSFDFTIADLEITEAYFSCKKSIDDDEYIFQKDMGDGITLIDATTGEYNVRVAPEDTEDVDLDSYYYDLEIRTDTDVFTILKGTLKIDYDITREVSNEGTV